MLLGVKGWCQSTKGSELEEVIGSLPELNLRICNDEKKD
jgi:hypothetical protein